VGDIVVTQSDSRGAAAFNNIQNQTFSIPAAGQLVAMNVTLGQYTSTFLADTGQRASQTQAFAASNMSLFAEVEARQANERGVSLDEELSNMMIYQQSYNAAARMVTTAKEIYDVLLSIA
jgi:flagellar hook-associated protein 1